MAELAQTNPASAAGYRASFARAADWLAIAVAASLPWSTSATGILVTLWLVAIVPTLDVTALRRGLAVPAAAIPVALCALAIIGMTWSDAPSVEQLGALKPFLRFLAIVLLLIQFQRSDRGTWVIGAYLVSCTLLLALSWVHAYVPRLDWPTRGGVGVPVKDSLIQSGEFLICAFALVHLALDAWRDRARLWAIGCAVLASAFVANMIFVATGRSTLLVLVVLIVVLGFQRFGWKGTLGLLIGAAILSAAAWTASPYLRKRVQSAFAEVHSYQVKRQVTSSGLRLEMWKKSVAFVAEAPLIGHGTGATAELFRRAASSDDELSGLVTDNPHNQTLTIAVQLGLVGVVVLYAMWLSHLLLFRGAGLVAWIGFGLVVHSIVSCLFNSFLFEFTLGWLYVFGVGVLGGMVLRARNAPAPKPV